MCCLHVLRHCFVVSRHCLVALRHYEHDVLRHCQTARETKTPNQTQIHVRELRLDSTRALRQDDVLLRSEDDAHVPVSGVVHAPDPGLRTPESEVHV